MNTMKKQTKPLRWVKLDNAAKIYPAARRKNWSNLFRQSVTLKEDVDVQVLEQALKVVVKRFPTIAARLRKGAFWYYLQQISTPVQISSEYSYPMAHMTNKQMRQCAFRVIVYHNRIALEFFHALTDGTGALIFLKNLVAEYLEQKHGIQIPLEHGILDRKAPPTEEEMTDCFPKFAGPVSAPRKDTNAWQMTGLGQADGFMYLTCFQIPVAEALKVAHQYGVTLTVFFSAVMMLSLYNMQAEQIPEARRQKRIKLLIPINLRKLYGCHTLRNFAMFTVPELDPRLGAYTFEEICQVIVHKMGTDFTQKHMSQVIATNVSSEQNPLVRLIPLPIKNAVMKAVFNSVGEKKCCLSLSNLGQVKVPSIMEDYIQRFDFIIGVQATSPYNCGMLSFGDTAYINFIRNMQNPALERHFYAVLQQFGIPVTVESNRNGR